MHIIKEQLGRVNHFLIILIPLFIVNAIFNLRYDWGGISVIARVYIMVLSFYIIFIFSQINVDDYRDEYNDRYGWRGRYYLFAVLRLFPFIFIYSLTIIFTLINYINTPDWPVEPVYRLLDGRYSNTVIYALILFVVLKQKKRPGISIPLFICCSMLYFGADKILYSLFDPGPGVSLIKLTKFFIFNFVLVYGYSKSHWRLSESVILSLIAGIISYSAVIILFTILFFISPPGSSSLAISGEIIMKSGFVFPLDELKKIIPDKGTQNDTQIIFQFIEKYGKETGYTPDEWEKIIQRNRIENNEFIFSHLNRKNIKLSFEMLKKYASTQLSVSQTNLDILNQFPEYFGSYYGDNKSDFYDLYKSGNDNMKLLILKSLAYTDDIDAINFLIDGLTSVEKKRSQTAYYSLSHIMGKDPAAFFKKEIYDLDIVLYFRDFASKKKAENQQ